MFFIALVPLSNVSSNSHLTFSGLYIFQVEFAIHRNFGIGFKYLAGFVFEGGTFTTKVDSLNNVKTNSGIPGKLQALY